MLIAYTDGSYNDRIKQLSWALVVLNGEDVVFEKSGSTIKTPKLLEYIKHRNVASEIFAAMYVMKWANKNNQDVTIVHDYEGLGKWARGEWKTNYELTRKFKTMVDEFPYKLNFEWVKGHNGSKWNEYVDKLCTSEYNIT
jgi:ribonuclease HI